MSTPPMPLPASPESRSALLTAIAWLAIVGSACTILGSAILGFLFAVGAAPSSNNLLFLLAGAVVAAVSVVAGVALLRRRNWARLFFAALFAVIASGVVFYLVTAVHHGSDAVGWFMVAILVVESLPILAISAWFVAVLLASRSRAECNGGR